MLTDEKKIDFVCVGIAKSGTTAMHNFLRQHKQIYMPLKKEIHHFAPDLLKKDDYWINSQHYFNLFKKAKQNQLVGETSVFYLLSDIAAQKIYSHNPNAKILIMLRNPVDVAYSLHSQLVFNDEENITNFIEALEIEEDRVNGNNLPPDTRIVKKHLYTEVVKYYNQIKRYYDVFPKQNIRIIFYDEFKKNTLSVVQKTYSFLGVDGKFVPKLKIFNSNKKIKSKFVHKISLLFSNKVLAHFFNEDGLERFKNLVIMFNSKKVKRKPLNKEVKNLIISRLKNEKVDLEKLVGKDLTNWYE